MGALIDLAGFVLDLIEALFYWRFVLTAMVAAALIWWVLGVVDDPLIRGLICVPTGVAGLCLAFYWQTRPRGK
jgi:hypothetical protein